jgi:hypothetical protein
VRACGQTTAPTRSTTPPCACGACESTDSPQLVAWRSRAFHGILQALDGSAASGGVPEGRAPPSLTHLPRSSRSRDDWTLRRESRRTASTAPTVAKAMRMRNFMAGRAQLSDRPRRTLRVDHESLEFGMLVALRSEATGGNPVLASVPSRTFGTPAVDREEGTNHSPAPRSRSGGAGSSVTSGRDAW